MYVHFNFITTDEYERHSLGKPTTAGGLAICIMVSCLNAVIQEPVYYILKKS
uniref:Uncharacterized protein n=1 Tax=Anguilla anguilla TaxID=7936 RepID=A0A0E9WSD4_ANGAN